MRLMVCSQPSGVVRRQEMRDRRSLSSAVWQGAQDLRTSSLVIGMPDSISSFCFSVGSFGFGGASCCASRESERRTKHPGSIRIGDYYKRV